MIKVDLLGSTAASFLVDGKTHTIDISRGCVTCTAARAMLTLGVDPAEKIDVQRDGKRVLEPCKSLAWWSARTVVEDAEQGPRIRLLSPTEPPHSANSASHVSDCPEDETPACEPSVREDV